MQPIVVAVDFSNTSIHCLEYAIPIANKVKSNIILVWVDKITAQESLYPDTSNQNRSEAKKCFEELIKEYGKKMSKGLKIEFKLRKGKIYHEIDSLANTVKALMVIAGAHGISGFEELWIGSNATKIVTNSSVPVITVRNDFKVTNSIRSILVPIDGSPETMQKLPFVARMAEYFQPKVYVVATHSSHLKSIQRLSEKNSREAAQFFKSNKIPYIQDSIVSNDITKAVISYAVEINVDLIAITKERETPMNLMMGPHAQQLINRSPIPVMCVHPHENSRP